MRSHILEAAHGRRIFHCKSYTAMLSVLVTPVLGSQSLRFDFAPFLEHTLRFFFHRSSTVFRSTPLQLATRKIPDF